MIGKNGLPRGNAERGRWRTRLPVLDVIRREVPSRDSGVGSASSRWAKWFMCELYLPMTR